MYKTIEEALEAVDIAEQDVIADMGPEVMEQGGYNEVVKAIAMDCTPMVRWELSRRTGVDLG